MLSPKLVSNGRITIKRREFAPPKRLEQVLQEVHHERAISQERLGLDRGYHRMYISLLKRGHNVPSLRTIFRLAVVLNIAPPELVHRVEVQMPTNRGTTETRSIQEVAPEELQEAILAILRIAFAMAQQDLAVTVARGLGEDREPAQVADELRER
jgi:transcriptional regulator with XRE-family HTH domain